MRTAPTDDTLEQLGASFAERLGPVVLDRTFDRGELTLTVQSDRIVDVIRLLRDDPNAQFICLIDICGADYPEREARFEIVYHLLSPKHNLRIRVKLQTNGAEPVPSLVELFAAANWFEREAFDMYGVPFSGHPDMRRILTDYGFQGYPMRKDFPLTGYVEVRYDSSRKKVVYEPVKLNQEFRNFDFLSPWEGLDHVLPGDEKATRNGGGSGS